MKKIGEVILAAVVLAILMSPLVRTQYGYNIYEEAAATNTSIGPVNTSGFADYWDTLDSPNDTVSIFGGNFQYNESNTHMAIGAYPDHNGPFAVTNSFGDKTELATEWNGRYGMRSTSAGKFNGFYFYTTSGAIRRFNGDALLSDVGGATYVINDDKKDIDFRVESAVDIYSLFMDGATGFASFGWSQFPSKLTVMGNMSVNNTLFVNEDGVVGIGTDSPSQALDVVGYINTPNSNGGYAIDDVSGTSRAVLFAQTEDLAIQNNFGADGGDIVLRSETGGGESMRVTVEGKVGINTDNPNGTLQVNAPHYTTSNYEGIYIQTSDNNATKGALGGGLTFGASSTNPDFTRDGASISAFQTSDDADGAGLAFFVRTTSNNVARTRAMSLMHDSDIGATGESDIGLGIGVEFPTSQLDVSGNMKCSEFVIPAKGFKNDFMRFARVPAMSALWTEGGTVLLFNTNDNDTIHSSGDGNFINGKYMVRRSTSAMNTVSVDLNLNTDGSSGNIGGSMSAENIQAGTNVTLMECKYDGEWYACLEFKGVLPRDGSFFYGVYNTTGSQQPFQTVDNDDALLTDKSVLISIDENNEQVESKKVNYWNSNIFTGQVNISRDLEVKGNITTIDGFIGIQDGTPERSLDIATDQQWGGTRVTNSHTTSGARASFVNNVGKESYMNMYSSGIGFGLANSGAFGSTDSIIIFSDASVENGGTNSVQLRAGGYGTNQERMRVSVENTTVFNDFIAEGNFTGNQIYGELWFDDESASGTITPIAVAMEWYNISGFNHTDPVGGDLLNGVTEPVAGELVPDLSGVYNVNYEISFERASGAVSREYEIALVVNGEVQNKSQSHRTIGNVNDVGDAGQTVKLILNSGDRVQMVVRNNGGTEDAGVHNAVLGMDRIGN